MIKLLLSVVLLFPIIVHSQWEQMGFDLLGSEQYENIGKNISINNDGDVFAVGSEEHNGLTQNYSGLCRVYQWTGSSWSTKGLAINGEEDDEYFGYNMSINADGNTVAASSIEDLDLEDNSSGCVRVYDYVNGYWEQKGETLRGSGTESKFGFDISLNAAGNRVAISSPLANVLLPDCGNVQVYEFDGNSWQQMGLDLEGLSEGEHFGHSISMNAEGNRLAIGAPLADINYTNSGSAAVYEWNGSAWNIIGDQLVGLAPGAETGSCVKLNEDSSTLAVGSPGFDLFGVLSENGTIKVYDWDSSNSDWIQRGANIIGIEEEVRCGENFDLSADGNTISSGEHRYNMELGAVRVFKWVNAEWTQQGNTITGSQLFDRCGSGIAVSKLGTRVAIGIPYAISTNDKGKIQIYRNISVGMEEHDQLTFDVFPNPSNGLVELNLAENDKWVIRSVLGEIIKSGRGSYCDLSNQPSGTFFIISQGKTARIIID